MSKAIYAGSFDPFTLGNLSIVTKAAKIFETVYVVIGVNPLKRNQLLPVDTRVTSIFPSGTSCDELNNAARRNMEIELQKLQG